MAGMKSTQAMRDRCRELSKPHADDYDRAVICVIDDLEAILKTGSASALLDALLQRLNLDNIDVNSLTIGEIRRAV